MDEEQRQTFWAVTMIEVKQAYARRQWATVRELLAQARDAPDAPILEDDCEREDVRTWEGLMDALVLHQLDAHRLVCAAVRLLVRRAQEREGASGGPDPTPQEQWRQLLADVEELDMDEVDAAAEGRRWPASAEKYLVRQPWDMAGNERAADGVWSDGESGA